VLSRDASLSSAINFFLCQSDLCWKYEMLGVIEPAILVFEDIDAASVLDVVTQARLTN